MTRGGHATELLGPATHHDPISPAAHAMGLTPDDCSTLRRHAMRLEAREDWALALDAYRMAAVVDPLQPSNWFGLGRCYRRLGDELTAARVEQCGRAIEERSS